MLESHDEFGHDRTGVHHSCEGNPHSLAGDDAWLHHVFGSEDALENERHEYVKRDAKNAGPDVAFGASMPGSRNSLIYRRRSRQRSGPSGQEESSNDQPPALKVP